MKTPKEYVNNFKHGIITEAMLSDCLFSVNKRAKNWRDALRKLKQKFRNCGYFFKFDIAYDNAESKMNAFYAMKDKFLTLLQPICIHHEIHENCFYDYEKDDYKIEVDHSYYLYYICGAHSFHHPIENPKDYPDLKVEKLEDNLETTGKEVGTLLSVQFCKKILELVESGDFELELESHCEE